MKAIAVLLVSVLLLSCQWNVEETKPYVKETYTVVRYSDGNEKSDCRIVDIHLKDDMPRLPQIPKTMTRDGEVGEITLTHMVELREYIKRKDKEIQDQLANCK